MAESAAFDHLCLALEQKTGLDRLAARGTVRIALRHAGLEPRTVSAEHLAVVVDRLLPRELESRGCADIDFVCAALKSGLSRLSPETSADGARDVFARLGGEA